MKKLALVASSLMLAGLLSGCVFHSGTDLSDVADRAGLTNVTTGDGTFENYTATGHYAGTELGIGVGIGPIKMMELYPAKSNEDLLADVAMKAKDDQADAMINVTPNKTFFMPIILPFVGIGVYVDNTDGTGIMSGM